MKCLYTSLICHLFSLHQSSWSNFVLQIHKLTFKWRFFILDLTHAWTRVQNKGGLWDVTVQENTAGRCTQTIKRFDAWQLEEFSSDETKGQIHPPLPPHHHFIITVIIPEMCLPPKLCINIPSPSLAASCIFQKTLRLFNLNAVFLFFPGMFFLSSLPPSSFSSSTLPLVYKKWTVIVVMQDSYLYCSPQRPSPVEITCLKLRPIINPAVIFKWLLTSGSWNQKLYK